MILMKKISRKFAVALSAIMVVGAMTISVSAANGSFTNKAVPGTGWVVFFQNSNGTYYTCALNITNWGSGSGDIEAELFCPGYGANSKTINGTGTTNWNDLFGISGNWTMSAKNEKKNSTRIVSGNWELG
jgi:hypothetical protein